MKAISIALLLVSSLGIGISAVPGEPVGVSMVQLIANPRDFDSKVVRVQGFARLEVEGDALYLNREDYQHQVYKNALWLDLTDELRKRRAACDKKYVVVEATFNARSFGHGRLFSGTLEKIQLFERTK